MRDVVGALGLDMEDLYPTPSDRAPIVPRRMITAGQALAMLEAESHFVAVVAGNLANGIKMKPEDVRRLMLAAGRIGYLRSQISV